MKKIIFTVESIARIAQFEKVTRVAVKDLLLVGDTLYVLVREEDVGRCVGKGASRLAILERTLGKKVRVIGYSKDILQFVKNVVHPIRVDTTLVGETIHITPHNDRFRSVLIGRNATHLRTFEEIVKRHFPISEIKVLRRKE